MRVISRNQMCEKSDSKMKTIIQAVTLAFVMMWIKQSTYIYKRAWYIT